MDRGRTRSWARAAAFRWREVVVDGGQRLVRSLPAPVRVRLIRLAKRADSGGVRLRRRAPDVSARPGPRIGAPEITVVVTSHNRSELLPVALRSVQRQDFPAFECIVVDDDSTDDAVAVAQSFAAADPRFRILLHGAALGPSATRNTGLAAARAPYVCFLDDDDFLLAGSLRARHAAFARQPADVAGMFCDWINVEPEVGLEAFRPRRSPQRRGIISLGSLGAGAPFILSSPLLRADVVRSVGGFDEALTRAEDTDLWFRLARLGFRFVDADCVGVAYRRTPDSLVTGAPAAQLDALLDVFERVDRPDETVIGHGPLPSPAPLSSSAVAHSRRLQVLRYVALIAADDADRAVAEGERSLPPIVRRAIDVDAVLPELYAHAVTRLALSGERASAFEGVLRSMLQRLVPEIEQEWLPFDDPGRWSASVVARGHRVGPRPGPAQGSSLGEFDDAVILVPEARYHVDELGPIADELRARDIPVRFMISPKTVPAALDELGRYTATILPYTPEAIGRARALVTLNDWGPLKQLTLRAIEAGVPTFAKVEGVQDFDDVESNWQRNPYRTAAYILAQGENDVAALPDKETFVVGSSRLERLWNAPPATPGGYVLVNLNFTFQVLTHERDRWLDSVRAALRLAGVRGVVSTHPAERGRVSGLPVARKPFRHEITRAGILVSRFSTVPFEAMARGVPFAYHNPHSERFRAFAQPDGAFRVCTTEGELAMAVDEGLTWRGDYRARCERFFARQVSIDPDRTSAERAADIIAKLSG